MEFFLTICAFMFIGMLLALIFGGIVGLFLNTIFFGAGVLIYFLPAIFAIYKKHPSAIWIFLINVFFGWTVIGWVIALLWAMEFHKTMEEFMQYRKEKARAKDDIIEGEYTKHD